MGQVPSRHEAVASVITRAAEDHKLVVFWLVHFSNSASYRESRKLAKEGGKS